MTAVGHVVGNKYRLLRLLGDGGMGTVYEAQHELLGTRVAIKVLHSDLARRNGLIDRFLQEARVAAQIKSPHVVQVTDVDRTAEGTAYLVMELLEGEALSSVLERDRKVPIPTGVDYTRQVLEALEAAHALGVTHRDLKPENVFVTFTAGRPVIKLIDFGIAKLRTAEAKNLTVAGVIMGTAEYMAPEQAYSADKADARSDIYAVGVMLYEMIAGVRPVSGEDARIIATRVERGEVTPLVHAAPDVPRELAGLVHRAMAARPELRFTSATEMRLALEGASLGEGGKRAATQKLVAGSGSTVLGAPAASAFTPAVPPVATPAPNAAAAPHGRVTGMAQRTAMPDADYPAPMRSPDYGPPPPFAQQQGAPHAPYTAPPRRSRTTWPYVVALPILLGVVAVVVVVVNGQRADAPPSPFPTSAPPVVETTPPGATTPPPQPTDTVAPLVPPAGQRPPVHPPAHPSGSARPPSSAPPPATTTPGLPPVLPPPVLPFPSTFPSTLPPFPSGLPSTLPFPPFQFPPAVPPATTPAPNPT